MTATATRPCISADSHITEPPNSYLDHIDPAYRDRAPRLQYHDTLGDCMIVDNGQSLVPMWLVAAAGRPTEEIRLDTGKHFEDLHRGGWDPEARLHDQDIDGVTAEIIYPSVGMILCNHPDRDYQKACFDAYNEWITEFCSFAPDRLVGLGQTAMRTPEEGIRDLEAIKAKGLRGVMLPGYPGQGDYDDPMYDEFWDAVVALELPASFHILTSKGDTPDRTACAARSSTRSSRSSAATRTSSAPSSSARCSNVIPICGSCAWRPTRAGRPIGCTAPTTPTTGIATG